MAQVTRSRSLYWLVLALSIIVSANVFAALKAITFSNLVNPTFGDLLGGVSGRNFILGTNGTISGANAGDYISGAAAGSVHISGSSKASISIQATNLTANGGVSIANVTCNYDATGDNDCVLGFTGAEPKSSGKTLLIGLEINTTTAHGDATAAPSFDIVISYI